MATSKPGVARAEGRTAALLGATGLVGGACLRHLLRSPAYERVRTLTRSPLPEELLAGATARPDARIVDFDRLESAAELFAVDHVFCAFGTTIGKAGTRERFREVDLEYPLTAARLARDAGATHFLLVSAVGADGASRVFYNRVKGELEDAVRALGFPALTILRPSVIGGDRDESRPTERLGQVLLRFAPKAWRTVPAKTIATALVRLGEEDRPGERVVESREIWKVAEGGAGG